MDNEQAEFKVIQGMAQVTLAMPFAFAVLNRAIYVIAFTLSGFLEYAYHAKAALEGLGAAPGPAYQSGIGMVSLVSNAVR